MRLVIAGPATLSQSPLLLPDAPAEPYSPSKIGPGFKPSSSYTCSIFFFKPTQPGTNTHGDKTFGLYLFHCTTDESNFSNDSY